MPAKAGISGVKDVSLRQETPEMPAFAGMTKMMSAEEDQ
jgi:hypothetical protein